MATEQTTGTQASESNGNAFPPFDPHTFAPTIFWLIITFGALYFIMSRFALPRVEGILKTRSNKIHGDLAAAREMRKEAHEASEAYERTLAQAAARSQALAQETREAVKLHQEGKRKTLEAELDRKLQAAELQIAETKAGAMSSVSQIASEAAAAIVQHITGKPADSNAVAAAIAETRA